MEQERICRLIEKCRQGDTVAFASIVREYQPLVYRLSFRLLCNEEEARDITQDSFIKIWLSLAGYTRDIDSQPGYIELPVIFVVTD